MNTLLIEITRNLASPFSVLIIQVFVILIVSRVCAYGLKLLGQPQVIGEMIAGIFLGKSVLGLFAPDLFNGLFPSASLPGLQLVSQLGLVLFMFVVGMQLKVSELKERAWSAVFISHVSIIFPFILGALLAFFLYPSYGPENFAFSSFALFMGISMSITAFPVLARIIQEKGLSETSLGAMALVCAAVDDVTAWCLLAAVIGIVKAGSVSLALTVLLATLLYVAFMLKLVRPFLLKGLHGKEMRINQLALIFCTLFGSSLIAEVIGIHALFGAFLAGAILPQNTELRALISGKIEDFTSVVLLPIFFAFTGIRTQIGLLDSTQSWVICLSITLVAILGKMGGSAMAARYVGMEKRESWALGALMNTRGLMELVVLNIGLDLGILSPVLFAMLVLMALITTTMTAPLVTFFRKSH